MRRYLGGWARLESRQTKGETRDQSMHAEEPFGGGETFVHEPRRAMDHERGLSVLMTETVHSLRSDHACPEGPLLASVTKDSCHSPIAIMLLRYRPESRTAIEEDSSHAACPTPARQIRASPQHSTTSTHRWPTPFPTASACKLYPFSSHHATHYALQRNARRPEQRR